jgi:hypothetical protein
MHLWCRLIPQATTTLNLLRQSHINSRLSAEVQLVNGAFDSNKTPLAPPGTQVVVHERTTQRGSWDTRCIDGWYLGPAPTHYRCYHVYISKTASKRPSDTVSFFTYNCPMPKTSSANAASAAATALIHALRHPAPASPFPPRTPTSWELTSRISNSTLPWSDMNTCDSPSALFPTKSSSNTRYITSSPRMDGCT